MGRSFQKYSFSQVQRRLLHGEDPWQRVRYILSEALELDEPARFSDWLISNQLNHESIKSRSVTHAHVYPEPLSLGKNQDDIRRVTTSGNQVVILGRLDGGFPVGADLAFLIMGDSYWDAVLGHGIVQRQQSRQINRAGDRRTSALELEVPIAPVEDSPWLPSDVDLIGTLSDNDRCFLMRRDSA